MLPAVATRLPTPIVSYPQFCGAIGRYVKRKISISNDPFVDGIFKSIWLFGPQAKLILAAFKVKLLTKYMVRTPVFRSNFMRTMWACSEEERKAFQTIAWQKIHKMPEEEQKRFKTLTLETEPGCTLEGISIRNPSFTKHLVYYGGTRYLWERCFDSLMALHRHLKVNITTYNYRDTTPSCKGDPTEEALTSDGTKIVDKLLAEGVEPKDITLYGASLGGGLAVSIGADFADKDIVFDVVSERSYRFIPAVVLHAAPVVGAIFAAFITSFGWLVRAEEKMHKLKGKLIVIYHPLDKVIRLPATLKKAIDEKSPSIVVKIIAMMDSTPLSGFKEAHCRDLTEQELAQLASHLIEEVRT